MRLLYKDAGDHIAVRDVSPVRIDKRDLTPEGRPKPIFRAVGEKVAESPPEDHPGWVEFEHLDTPVKEDAEVEFDHTAGPEELAAAFPNHKWRPVALQGK